MVTDHVLNNMQDKLKTLQQAMQYQIDQVKESKATLEDPNLANLDGQEDCVDDP